MKRERTMEGWEKGVQERKKNRKNKKLWRKRNDKKTMQRENNWRRKLINWKMKYSDIWKFKKNVDVK